MICLGTQRTNRLSAEKKLEIHVTKSNNEYKWCNKISNLMVASCSNNSFHNNAASILIETFQLQVGI